MMRWIFLLPANLIAPVVSFVLAPAVVLFANEDGWLPRWLWWAQTPDQPLDGDNGWRTEPEHAPYLGDPSTLTKWQRYWNRVRWLWRNPAYGFDSDVLGAKFSRFDTVTVSGDVTIHDGDNAKAGWCKVVIGPYWQFLYIRPVPFFPKRCFYINLGWSIKTYGEDPSRMYWPDSDKLLSGGMIQAQYLCSPRFAKFN